MANRSCEITWKTYDRLLNGQELTRARLGAPAVAESPIAPRRRIDPTTQAGADLRTDESRIGSWLSPVQTGCRLRWRRSALATLRYAADSGPAIDGRRRLEGSWYNVAHAGLWKDTHGDQSWHSVSPGSRIRRSCWSTWICKDPSRQYSRPDAGRSRHVGSSRRANKFAERYHSGPRGKPSHCGIAHGRHTGIIRIDGLPSDAKYSPGYQEKLSVEYHYRRFAAYFGERRCHFHLAADRLRLACCCSRTIESFRSRRM